MISQEERDEIQADIRKAVAINEAVRNELRKDNRDQILIYDPDGRVNERTRSGCLRRRVVVFTKDGPAVTLHGEQRLVDGWADLSDGLRLFFAE